MQSRTLDIDLLYYGDRTVATEQLTLPHPRMAERNFVLVPLAEVASDWVDPLSGLSVETLRQRCTDPSWVRRLGGQLVAPEPL